ncbi:UPF0545 protein C22orf39 homolog isoform X2 [Peromyscus californicus insignis]|uniref:UPF0545 protein C22orf39 homolog isoform X2 n=1 Tax=Peromyscus californicus insignis TaxID=564181 RepID=UPI0022A68D77|nr:UPF0545 protein C22orf39 homolog isoform X2 [Peromyscus californicus insignis]
MSLSVTRGLDMAVAGRWQPPRPCEVYRAEWELCRSAGHLLHHYYVHGERPDCRQWLRDLASCREWEESRSPQAQVQIYPTWPATKTSDSRRWTLRGCDMCKPWDLPQGGPRQEH